MTAATTFLAVLVLLTAVLLAVAGVWLARMGYAPRRRGKDPHCRRCDYLLLALESSRCPECGIDLSPANIVLGDRLRRPGLIVSGLGLLLVSLILIVPSANAVISQIDWYQFKPTSLVFKDLQSSGLRTAGQALDELKRRAENGSLSLANKRRFIDAALAEQGAATSGVLGSSLVDIIAEKWAFDAMTDQQRDLFFSQCQRVALKVRAQVVLGDTVPYRVEHSSRTPTAGNHWWVSFDMLEHSLDNQPPVIHENRGGHSYSAGYGGGGSTGSEVRCDQPGEHQFNVTGLTEVFNGPFGERDASKLAWSGKRKLEQKFQILESAPENYIKQIDDASLAPAIQASISPVNLSANRSNNQVGLQGQLNITNAPENLAFDVVFRADGKEYPMSTLTIPKGGSTHYGIMGWAKLEKPPATVDVILRSSEKAARRTVELTSMWKGELIYLNVPVKDETKDQTK